MLHVLSMTLPVLFLAAASPVLLERVTAHGRSPRSSVAAWLALSAAAPLALLGVAAVLALGALPHAANGHVGGGIPVAAEYQGWQIALAVAPTALLVWIGAVVIAEFRRNAAIRGRHLERLRMVRLGHAVPGATVLGSAVPAVYCVPGRPPAVVVSTGALDVLGAEELAAVLAHERAHLAGRHHALLTLLHGLRRAVPFFPAFRRAEAAVGPLLEMCADDKAARAHGRTAVAAALAELGQYRAPAPALGATGPGAVLRVRRLLHPPSPGWHGSAGVLLGAVAAIVAPLVPLALPPLMMLGAGHCPLPPTAALGGG